MFTFKMIVHLQNFMNENWKDFKAQTQELVTNKQTDSNLPQKLLQNNIKILFWWSFTAMNVFVSLAQLQEVVFF